MMGKITIELGAKQHELAVEWDPNHFGGLVRLVSATLDNSAEEAVCSACNCNDCECDLNEEQEKYDRVE